MATTLITGDVARKLGRAEKWALLSPHLTRHGGEALSYATLQAGMEYFVDDEYGYIAFTTVQHPVFARQPKRIVLSDPICAPKDRVKIMTRFLADNPRAVLAVISESFAEAMRPLKFKVNCVGYEPELFLPTYNTKGNWKDLDLIKRARNEAKREGITIAEERHIEQVDAGQLDAVTADWMGHKRVSDREIWIYARRPVYEPEDDVRKFVARNTKGCVVGFAFYDPMYRDGRVYGYSANISRCDEQRYGKLATAIHMEAAEIFKAEGKEILNLCLAPFVKLHLGKFNDDYGTAAFFKLSERYGNEIYNFQGLSFHKSKYRGAEKPLYYASNSRFPSNDIYLAFLSADITRSYFTTMFQLLRGMAKAPFQRARLLKESPACPSAPLKPAV